MTDTPDDSLPPLDDPAILAEIEAEFAELTAEIDRISALPMSDRPRKLQLLEMLRADWRKKAGARADLPEWRQKIDAAVGDAVERILEDGLRETADGQLAFDLKGDAVQAHGGPVLNAMLDGFKGWLLERFPPEGAAPPEPSTDVPAPGDAAAAEDSEKQAGAKAAQPAFAGTALAPFVEGLGRMFAQAVQNIDFSKAVKPSAPASKPETAASGGEEPGPVGVQEREGAEPVARATSPKDGDVDVSVASDGSTKVTGSADVNSSVSFDTRDGNAPPPAVEALQGVFKNLGAMLQQTLGDPEKLKSALSGLARSAGTATQAPPASKPSSTAAPSPAEPPPAAAPTSDAKDAAPPKPPEPKPASADATPKQPVFKVDFGGILGALLKPRPPAAATAPERPPAPVEDPPPAEPPKKDPPPAEPPKQDPPPAEPPKKDPPPKGDPPPMRVDAEEPGRS